MAGRIRTIKPEILDDELAANLSDAAWRLWVSSWLLADDHADCRSGEKYLAASVWQDTSRDVAKPLAELISKGFVEPYSVDGQRYFRIRGWAKHQRIDNAGKPRMPTPDEDDGEWKQALAPLFAESHARLRKSPRPAALPASSPEIPLARAPAHDRGETTTPITNTTSTPTASDDRARSWFDEQDQGQLVEVPVDAKLPPEWRAIAETNYTVSDIDQVFAEFVAWYRAKGQLQRRWLEMWKLWLGRKQGDQRKQRERDAQAGNRQESYARAKAADEDVARRAAEARKRVPAAPPNPYADAPPVDPGAALGALLGKWSNGPDAVSRETAAQPSTLIIGTSDPAVTVASVAQAHELLGPGDMLGVTDDVIEHPPEPNPVIPVAESEQPADDFPPTADERRPA